MTLPASPDQVRAVDGRPWIARGQDVVRPMTARAIRHHWRAQLRCQAMIALEIGGLAPSLHAEFLRQPHALVTPSAGVARQVLRRDRGVGIAMRLDGVNSVAVRADRGLAVAACNRLPVNAPGKLLPVTRTACSGDIGVIHPRLGIAGRQQFVWAAVTIYAGRGLRIAALNGLRVVAVIVCRLLVGVAGRTRYFRRSSFMRRTLQIRMAIYAGKYAAVNRVLEGVRIHIQADTLAVLFLVQRRIAVTGQALIVGGPGRFFLRQRHSAGEQQQQKQNSGLPASAPHRSPAFRGHAWSTSAFVRASPLLRFATPLGYESSHGGT